MTNLCGAAISYSVNLACNIKILHFEVRYRILINVNSYFSVFSFDIVDFHI